MTVFYKYRSTGQLQFTLDILMRHRLFAARYSELNDPMEGLWHYGGEGTLWPDEIRYVEDQIDKYRVTSISLNPVSTLMWTHYADSHRGLVIGIEIPQQDGASLVPVRYSSHYTISKDAAEVGLDVLSKKFKVWEYEHEVRVLGSKDFINVVPREILFGIRADRKLTDLITEIARTYCPKAEIRHLKLSDLDTYVEPIPFDASDA